jgi:murein L,D-transpeptidase YafK
MKSKSLFIFFISVVISICVYFNYSKNRLPENIRKADKVLVLKSKREMHLLREGEIIRTYRISLGDDPVGHKEKEGDEKTPEGNYILDWRNSKSVCYKSIHISYPNETDKAKAKKLGVPPGGNIMIHGLHKSLNWLGSLHVNEDWTDGCIAVTNEEMDEIWRCIKYGTPIEIKK